MGGRGGRREQWEGGEGGESNGREGRKVDQITERGQLIIKRNWGEVQNASRFLYHAMCQYYSIHQ